MLPAVTAHTDLLRRADGILFCFPHWWFSMPAMLKGYFDRVWGRRIAFEHDLAGGRIKPLLTNVKVFDVVPATARPGGSRASSSVTPAARS